MPRLPACRSCETVRVVWSCYICGTRQYTTDTAYSPFSVWASPTFSGQECHWAPGSLYRSHMVPCWSSKPPGNTCVLVLALALPLLDALPAHKYMTHSFASFRLWPKFHHCSEVFLCHPLKIVAHLYLSPTLPTSLSLFFSNVFLSSFLLVLFFTVAFPDHGMCSLSTRRENKWTIGIRGCWGWLG